MNSMQSRGYSISFTMGMDREAAAYALNAQITFAETPTKPL
jgi:hypothetical protein